MNDIIVFSAGILLVFFVNLSYRPTKSYLEQNVRDHSVFALLWANAAFAALTALGVFFVVEALASSGVLNELRSYFLPSAQTGTLTNGEPGDTGGQVMGLVFAALGIVMTLVTTIVISVSRASIEDIRRIEDRFISKRDEINRGIEDIHRAREISEAQLALLTKSIRASRSNIAAIKSIKSDLDKKILDQRAEYDFRIQIEEFYSANDGNLDEIELFANAIHEQSTGSSNSGDFFAAMGKEGLDYVTALNAMLEICYRGEQFAHQTNMINGIIRKLTCYCHWHEIQQKQACRSPSS